MMQMMLKIVGNFSLSFTTKFCLVLFDEVNDTSQDENDNLL